MSNITFNHVWISNSAYTTTGWDLHELPESAQYLRAAQEGLVRSAKISLEVNRDFILSHEDNMRPVVICKRPEDEEGLEFRRFLYFGKEDLILEDGIGRREFSPLIENVNYIKNPREAELINYIRSQFAHPYSELNVMKQYLNKIKQIRGN